MGESRHPGEDGEAGLQRQSQVMMMPSQEPQAYSDKDAVWHKIAHGVLPGAASSGGGLQQQPVVFLQKPLREQTPSRLPNVAQSISESANRPVMDQ